jgi:hypothetical protein
MTPTECPGCHANMDGGPIPEPVREYYQPPYRWSRLIAMQLQYSDYATTWVCPDCKYEWPR